MGIACTTLGSAPQSTLPTKIQQKKKNVFPTKDVVTASGYEFKRNEIKNSLDAGVSGPNAIRGMSTAKSTMHNKWSESSKEAWREEWINKDEETEKEKEEEEEEVTKYLLTVRERYSDTLIHNTTGKCNRRKNINIASSVFTIY